jgi:IMP and pyridine-specific 5'-nucleotidase
LVELEDDEWKLDEMKQWKKEDIEQFLKDVSEKIVSVADEINLSYKYKLIKKPMAVGYVPIDLNSRGRAESCDEISLALRRELKPPFKWCSFHSNGQVWVDIGNKSLGVKAFQKKFGVTHQETLHIGDQWREVGNDIAARKSACTLWIVQPKETKFFLELLMSDFEKNK